MKKMISAAVVTVACCLFAQTASAALIAYEGFDYPNDTPAINGLDGGSGWNGGWVDGDGDFAGLSQDDVSLDSAAFPFASAGDRLIGQGGGEGVRNFGPLVDVATDGALYMSLLLNKTSDGGGSADNFEVRVGPSSFADMIRFGSGSSENWILILNGTNGGVGNLTVGDTYFAVLRLTTTSGEDELSAMVYGPGDVVPALEPAVWDMSVTKTLNTGVIDQIRLEVGANSHGDYDEFRIGSDWASVAVDVPEPTCVALTLMGSVAGMASLRRRR
ncbi:MAG: PEP-CTERM sorting domain-containing protein [Planctomycetales bacterium]|nr:PEP-CTERM sorting domain-containing protein [Planctomycetales bacterium]